MGKAFASGPFIFNIQVSMEWKWKSETWVLSRKTCKNAPSISFLETSLFC
jgi:hypothetical protein